MGSIINSVRQALLKFFCFFFVFFLLGSGINWRDRVARRKSMRPGNGTSTTSTGTRRNGEKKNKKKKTHEIYKENFLLNNLIFKFSFKFDSISGKIC